MSKYLDKLNTKIKLLKYLHKPRTKRECIQEVFSDSQANIDSLERTIRNYIREGDIEIGNVTIPFKIKKIRSTRDSFSDGEESRDGYGEIEEKLRSSVHPIILPLNLTEVYMLTNGLLDNLGSSHPQYKAYQEIASKIYSQLSDYGKQIINQNKHGLVNYDKVTYTNENDYVDRNYGYLIGKANKQSKEVLVETVQGNT
ncbi:MAG: hypothetical protein ACI4U3_00870, partial [Traorella sp.]